MQYFRIHREPSLMDLPQHIINHLAYLHAKATSLDSLQMAVDDDRAVRVVDDVVTDATHDGSTDGAETSGSHDDHGCLLLFCHVHNHLTWLVAEDGLNLSSQLATV